MTFSNDSNSYAVNNSVCPTERWHFIDCPCMFGLFVCLFVCVISYHFQHWLGNVTAVIPHKMVPDTFLPSAQHIKIGLASLSSQTLFKNMMDSVWNEWLRVKNIS